MPPIDRQTYPLDSFDPTPDLVAMSPAPPRVDPPWWTPKRPHSLALTPIDFFQCACGADVWRSADQIVREYGEGDYHYCPQEEPTSLHDLADALAEAQDDAREARGARAPEEAPAPESDADDALRGL